MSITIRATAPAEAAVLAQIQQEAFQPLYEQFHDDGNPFLRGTEDILRRLNKQNRYFTILQDNQIVGGLFYRLYGKRSPTDTIGSGEYYLARIYVHPNYQNKGIAREAILQSEKEFPDAVRFFVDFPQVLTKNRRCYESAGYIDTGRCITADGAPSLAMFQKTLPFPSHPSGVTHPLIFPIERGELPECTEVIRRSFSTVAADFGLTRENCPKFTGFLSTARLEAEMDARRQMYGLYAGKKIIGYLSLAKENDETYELNHLAVLPAFRHHGFGKALLEFAAETVHAWGGKSIKIGIMEENKRLKNWYLANGFAATGTKKFTHLPFTSGFLERRV